MSAELKEIYSEAYSAYENGQSDRAGDLFTYLILQDPTQQNFWQGLAAAQQVQGFYKEAAMAWSMASYLDAANPASHLHAAECYICLGEKEEALKELDLALQQPCTEDLIKKIELMKKGITHG
jgi:type III secretion system low calcium response chaperone LcrH/SycD